MRSVILIPAFFGTAVLAQTQYTSTAAAAVAKARATALTESPTSNVAGKTFDRFVAICKFLAGGALLCFQVDSPNLRKESLPRPEYLLLSGQSCPDALISQPLVCLENDSKYWS